MLAAGAGFHRGSLGDWWSLVAGVLAEVPYPGVKLVDHYDLQNFGNLHIPIHHYSCLDSRIWMVDTSGAGDC